jgi:hypothetical protein
MRVELSKSLAVGTTQGKSGSWEDLEENCHDYSSGFWFGIQIVSDWVVWRGSKSIFGILLGDHLMWSCITDKQVSNHRNNEEHAELLTWLISVRAYPCIAHYYYHTLHDRLTLCDLWITLSSLYSTNYIILRLTL